MQQRVALGKIIQGATSRGGSLADILKCLTRGSLSDHPALAGQLLIKSDADDLRRRNAGGPHSPNDGCFSVNVLGSAGLQIGARAVVETDPHDDGWTPRPQRFSITHWSSESVSGNCDGSSMSRSEIHPDTVEVAGDSTRAVNRCLVQWCPRTARSLDLAA